MTRNPLVICAAVASVLTGSSAVSQSPTLTLRADVYEMSESRQQTGYAAQTNRARFTVAGARSRYDFVRNESPSHPGIGSEGTYMVVLHDRRIISVNPATREYYYLDLSKALGGVNDILSAVPAGLTMNFTDAVTEATDLREDRVILGYPTKHWRLRQSATINVGIAGEEVSLRLETVIDRHIATDLPLPKGAIPGATFLSTDPGSPFRSFMDTATIQRVAEENRKIPNGMPLRSSTRVSSGAAGMMTMLSSMMEVTSIARTEVPADFFDLPKGFKLIEMPVPAMPSLGPPG